MTVNIKTTGRSYNQANMSLIMAKLALLLGELEFCWKDIRLCGRIAQNVTTESINHLTNCHYHTGLWLRTGCVTNAQVSFSERTGF